MNRNTISAMLMALFGSALVCGTIAYAGSIKTWSNGEVIQSTDLNTTLAHIHTAAEASITNAKVSTGAAIAHSKLATPALIPKVWAVVALCTTGTCTIQADSGINTVVAGVTDGEYTIDFDTDRANANYATFITTNGAVSTFCSVTAYLTTGITIDCENDAGADTDVGFSIMVLDNDN